MSKAATQAKHELKVTTPADREIRTERIFDAPRERVWRAHTEADLVKHRPPCRETLR